MLSVEEAREQILAHIHPLEVESCPLNEALGRVLAEDAIAAEALPPFDNSAMDGYALHSTDTAQASATAPVQLRIVGAVPAGSVYDGVLGAGEAIRILTGAPVPAGADAVLQQELVTIEGTLALITEAVASATNIRPAGDDIRPGMRLIPAGSELGPAEIALLAGVGIHPVPVRRRPRVAILATGDELASLGATPRAGQIRETNSLYLAAAITRAGGDPFVLGIAADREEEIRSHLRRAQEADLILSSGGVSVGDFDLVKQILARDGSVEFWRVRLRPGKPLAFGLLGNTPFIGLPGNPVSAAVTFELFGRPTIRRMLGCRRIARPIVDAVLRGEDIALIDRRHYVRARLATEGTTLVAHPTGNQGSHVMSSLRGASAYLILPEGEGVVHAGETVPAMLLNDNMPWNDE